MAGPTVALLSSAVHAVRLLIVNKIIAQNTLFFSCFKVSLKVNFYSHPVLTRTVYRMSITGTGSVKPDVKISIPEQESITRTDIDHDKRPDLGPDVTILTSPDASADSDVCSGTSNCLNAKINWKRMILPANLLTNVTKVVSELSQSDRDQVCRRSLLPSLSENKPEADVFTMVTRLTDEHHEMPAHPPGSNALELLVETSSSPENTLLFRDIPDVSTLFGSNLGRCYRYP